MSFWPGLRVIFILLSGYVTKVILFGPSFIYTASWRKQSEENGYKYYLQSQIVLCFQLEKKEEITLFKVMIFYQLKGTRIFLTQIFPDGPSDPLKDEWI